MLVCRRIELLFHIWISFHRNNKCDEVGSIIKIQRFTVRHESQQRRRRFRQRFSPGTSGSISSPRGEPLTHLSRVMATRTPRWLPYIHIVRRGVNARRVPVLPFPGMIMVADIHESERSVCASPCVIHGIHSPVPAPYTCSYASSVSSPSSFLPRFTFPFFVLSPISFFTFTSFERIHI